MQRSKMKTALCISLKVIQLIFTVTTLILKKLFDDFSERVFYRNQKFSTEWILLSNINWTREINDFHSLTFVGYVFITAVLLLARIIRQDNIYCTCEIILLCFGTVFYTIEGVLILFSVEQLPEDTLPHAWTVGGLSLACASLFVIDLLLFKKIKQFKNVIIQTETDWMVPRIESVKYDNMKSVDAKKCCQPQEVKINDNRSKYLRTDL